MTSKNNDQNKYNDVVKELQDYILDEKNIDKALETKIISNKEISKKEPINSNKKGLFIPSEKDSLFWCFYIFKYGEIKYEILNNKNEVISKQIKIEFIEKIRKEKKTVKIYKFDTISNIESNLVNDTCISSKTFLTLCALENINVIFISKKTFFELRMNDSEEIYILYEINNSNSNGNSNGRYITKYGFELGNFETINNIRSTLYQVEKIDKPIMAFSSYKTSDLVNICQKLAIETINKDTNKLKSKKDLYEGIIQYF